MALDRDVTEVNLPHELSQLASLIDERPEAFASGDKEIQDAALAATKYMFDLSLKSEAIARPHIKDLLDSIASSQAPQTRARTRSEGEAQKTNTSSISYAILAETPLSSLFVDGMVDEQIWAQLELKANKVCETLEHAFDADDPDKQELLDSSESEDENENDELDSDELEELRRAERSEDESKPVGESEEEDGSELSAEDLEEKVTELRDSSSDEDVLGDRVGLEARSVNGSSTRRRSRKSRHTELDDDFFSLADFNAEVEAAEARKVSRGSLGKDTDDDEEIEEDTGTDYFAVLDEQGAREACYKDFFDPPPKPDRPLKRKIVPVSSDSSKRSKVRFNEQVKVKTIKANGKGRPLWASDEEEDDGDDGEDGIGETFSDSPDEERSQSELGSDESGSGSRSEIDMNEVEQGREAVQRLKDDLFADEESGSPSKSGLSTYEARMESLRSQIAELEAENVTERDWVLKGEVTSRSRPQNGLLEEDLEFEHITKTVPVVTDELVQDLEERIKARIVEGRFDDVVRRRALDDKPLLPSQVFELQDTKSKESLAQIYENEYMATQSGDTTDDRDARLQKEHEEIEKQWEHICYKLDGLCNAHFTPKQPKATISTVPNVSAISLESPLPTAKAASAVLAPQEIFSPSASDLRSKSELTPIEKRVLRSKERKKRKKQREMLQRSVDKFAKAKEAKGSKRQKEDAMKSLVKSGKGVTIIGKKSKSVKEKK